VFWQTAQSIRIIDNYTVKRKHFDLSTAAEINGPTPRETGCSHQLTTCHYKPTDLGRSIGRPHRPIILVATLDFLIVLCAILITLNPRDWRGREVRRLGG
jgi:hypothetical protein